MKISKKILAVVLSAVIMFSIFVPASNAYTIGGTRYLISDEIKAITTAQLLNVTKALKTITNVLTGKGLNYESNMSIEFKDGMARELCRYISDNSALDIEALCTSISLDTTLLETVYTLTDTDTTAIREQMRELRRKLDAEQKKELSTMVYFLENYLTVIKKVEVYTADVGTDGTTRAGILVTRMDGTQENLLLDLYFSPEGLVYGANGNGILGLGYECSVYDLVIYATVNCWMRSFGFCLFYDIFCYTTPFFNYVTRRFKFDYAGKEWMIQAWKGNYVIANGCEIGIYNRDKAKFGSYYDCYDGVMNMSFELTKGDELVLEMSGEHWWLNGFKLGDTLYKPSSMTLSFSIEFLDEEMANAFAESVNNHYRHDTSCTVDGNTVSVVW